LDLGGIYRAGGTISSPPVICTEEAKSHRKKAKKPKRNTEINWKRKLEINALINYYI
jgi:hypothetical protein